jgi:hypothetical protein
MIEHNYLGVTPRTIILSSLHNSTTAPFLRLLHLPGIPPHPLVDRTSAPPNPHLLLLRHLTPSLPHGAWRPVFFLFAAAAAQTACVWAARAGGDGAADQGARVCGAAGAAEPCHCARLSIRYCYGVGEREWKGCMGVWKRCGGGCYVGVWRWSHLVGRASLDCMVVVWQEFVGGT